MTPRPCVGLCTSHRVGSGRFERDAEPWSRSDPHISAARGWPGGRGGATQGQAVCAPSAVSVGLLLPATIVRCLQWHRHGFPGKSKPLGLTCGVGEACVRAHRARAMHTRCCDLVL